ncbi:MAG TPA: sulfotransferase [Stellaceae bacterium]|nr:sulfotransferase [Stellaceae bacterium]
MKKLFVVGAARSGTSWLQIILGNHDGIATVRETHLFDNYISKLYESWENEAQNVEKDGLRLLMDRDAMDDVARSFADKVFARIEAAKPGAQIMLEKTPTHIYHHRLIHRLYPDALFLHMVRDPRAVVASMLAASKESWGVWAPNDLITAARVWRDCARIGHREMAAYGAQTLELRYEDLSADPDVALARIWNWLGLDPQPYDRERFSVDSLRGHGQNGVETDPAWENRTNFFRRGQTDSWIEELKPEEIAIVEGIAGQLFHDLGYTPHI